MAISNAAKAGAVIFVGAVQFGFGMLLAEIYYPGYNVSTNAISDLGATCTSSGSCVIQQPSATIFDASIILLGLLVLLGAYFLQRAYHWKPASAMIVLMGIGALGVGIFPESAGLTIHHLFSVVAFLFAGLSALVLARYQRKPMLYFSFVLGLMTLGALFLYLGSEYAGLGAGGMERMIVYPVLLWAIGFGGHLMAADETPMK
jgi:hypothetical membrane protein